MPYIRPSQRVWFDHDIEAFPYTEMTKGEVNYVISSIVTRWVEARAEAIDRVVDYGTASDGHSVLQDAAAEFYRRVVAPYEDQKVAENGDVYRSLTGEKR